MLKIGITKLDAKVLTLVCKVELGFELNIYAGAKYKNTLYTYL